MQFITWLDYILLPIYFGIFYALGRYLQNKYYPVGHPWRNYFFYGYIVKLMGAVFIGLIYQYYYNGIGDTVLFFKQAKVIYELFWESPSKAFNLIMQIPPRYAYGYYEYTSKLIFYGDHSSFTVTSIESIFNLLCFNTYLASSLFFAAMSFFGMWSMFKIFARIYEDLSQYIAIAFLFIPSTILWGSGIFKDSICMFALGILLSGIYNLYTNRKLNIYYIAYIIGGFFLLYTIKIYILLAFIPAVVYWIVMKFVSGNRNSIINQSLKFLVIPLVILSLLLVGDNFSKELGRYSIDNIVETAEVTNDYILSTTSENGSGYDIGLDDYTPTGLLKVVPAAINVTLFRPYLWEAKKLMVFFNAMEAFLFLLIALKLLFELGPIKIYRAVMKDVNIQFFLIFTFIFAFAVGISSGNFGALSRYRIPILPFFFMALALIYYTYKPITKKLLSIRN